MGNARKLLASAMLPLACITAGCAHLFYVNDVTDQSDLSGIPFLVKVPALVHETKYQVDAFRVQAEIHTHLGTKNDQITHYPDAPITLINSDLVLAEIRSAAEDLGKVGTTITGPDTLRQQIQEHFVLMQNANQAAIKSGKLQPLVVSNVWDYRAVLAPGVHSVNIRQPWIGQASSTIELNEDGTLKSTQGSAQPSALQTLASLIPVSEFLKKQWNITDGSTKAEKLHSANSTNQPLTVNNKGQTTTVLLVVQPTELLVELRTVQLCDYNRACPKKGEPVLAPIKFNAAFPPANALSVPASSSSSLEGVQVVAVTDLSAVKPASASSSGGSGKN
jgi:hypothetical protein